MIFNYLFVWTLIFIIPKASCLLTNSSNDFGPVCSSINKLSG